MPVMNFDLEDGLPPVSFTLKTDDAERFMDFMAECQAAKNSAQQAQTAPVNVPSGWKAAAQHVRSLGTEFFHGPKEYAAAGREAVAKAILAAAPSSPIAANSEDAVIPAELREIGRLLATQDNRITDQPIFIVQQKRSYVTDADYNDCRYEWRETESGDYTEATPERVKRLDAIYKKTLREPKGWKRYAMMDVWEFVTACFTEQGCKDYIKCNGHNLKEPRIYAEGSFRNNEYQTVRNWLLSIAATQQKKEGEA